MDKPKAKVTIASLVYTMIKEGKTDEAVIKVIKKKFPESQISEKHMNWYRRQLKLQSQPKAKKDEVKKAAPKKDAVKDDDNDVEDEDVEDDEDDELEDEEDKE